MLEELQIILPMLEKITDGAFAGFVIYLVVSFLHALVSPVFWCLALIIIGQCLRKSLQIIANAPENLERTVTNKDGEEITILKDVDIVGLFKAINNNSKYLHPSDVERAIKKLSEK